jgi:hypothetical protein
VVVLVVVLVEVLVVEVVEVLVVVLVEVVEVLVVVLVVVVEVLVEVVVEVEEVLVEVLADVVTSERSTSQTSTGVPISEIDECASRTSARTRAEEVAVTYTRVALYLFAAR